MLCLWEMERQRTTFLCRLVFVLGWGERGTGVLGMLYLWEMELFLWEMERQRTTQSVSFDGFSAHGDARCV